MSLDTILFPIQIGGHVCLDFANTVEFRRSERCREFLCSYEHTLAWCWRCALIGEAEAARLDAESAQRPAEAAAAYRAALDLRETLYRLFAAVIDGVPPAGDDLARLNDRLARAQRRIEPGACGFTWTWPRSDHLADVLTPVALAAAELLTSDQLQWVRQCPNCGWLFLDTSRNHSRRWCSMEFCGSQVKSRRQYERRKKQR